MCWHTNYKIYSKKKVADRDIPVFKIVDYVEYRDIFRSYFYTYQTYKLGNLYSTYLDDPDSFSNIRSGFHSYSCDKCRIIPRTDGVITVSTSKTSITHYLPNYPDTVVKKMSCIIPKGSKYYENEYGEIVSDNIKPVSIE